MILANHRTTLYSSIYTKQYNFQFFTHILRSDAKHKNNLIINLDVCNQLNGFNERRISYFIYIIPNEHTSMYVCMYAFHMYKFTYLRR